MSILLKISSLCILTLALNGCLALTLAGGAVGMGDSFYKDHKINKLEKKIEALEKLEESNKIKKPKPYVPSYTEMDGFTKGFYDTMYNRDGK
jgi:hypothetical protein